MKHGEVGHFLVSHLLPILLMYGAVIALVGMLLYFYKKKKGGAKQSEKEPEGVEFLWEIKPNKRRRKKK